MTKRAPAPKKKKKAAPRRRVQVVEEEYEEFELTATTKGGTPSSRKRWE